MVTQTRPWTVEEYHQMLTVGLLDSQDRVELLVGQIIEMSPQEPPHAATTRRISRYCDRLLADLADVRTQLPITLAPHSEPEPDLAIVRLDEREYCDRHPSPEDIFALIEVSDSTLTKDLDFKAQIYAQASIPDYWVLDVNRQQCHIFREPTPSGYQSHSIFHRAEQVALLAFPEHPIPLTELFLPDH